MLDKDVQIHIDYISFTFPLYSPIGTLEAFNDLREDLANLFFMDISQYGELKDWGHDGYKNQLSLGQNIIIRFGGLLTQIKAIGEDGIIDYFDSCMVELKGQACREIEFLSGGTIDYINIIEWVMNHNGRFTRLDIAIDDMKGDIISFDTVINQVKKGLYTSCFRGDPEIISSALNKDNMKKMNDLKGTSLYFGKSNGKRRNQIELCIYDKAAERRFNNDTFVSDYWVRYEMRFRKDNADALAFHIYTNDMEDIGIFACEQLKRLLTIKENKINGEPTKSLQVYTFDVHPQWDMFLGVVKGTKFSLRPVMENTIEKKLAWRQYSLTRQNILLDLADPYKSGDFVLPPIAKAYEELKEKRDYLLENRDKITEKDINMINNYKRKNNKYYDLISLDSIDDYIKQLNQYIEEIERIYLLPF